MYKVLGTVLLVFTFMSCSSDQKSSELVPETKEGKKVVYQVFTRLFGNANTTNNLGEP